MIDVADTSGSESLLDAPDAKACASLPPTFPISQPSSHRAADAAPSSTLRYVMPVCFFFRQLGDYLNTKMRELYHVKHTELGRKVFSGLKESGTSFNLITATSM